MSFGLTRQNQREVASAVVVDPVGVVYDDSGNLDAFSRLRVSSSEGFRMDSTFTYDKQPLLFDEIKAGAGSAVFDSNLRAVYLATGGLADADEAALRLHFATPYTPGNSQLIVMTGCLNPDASAQWTNSKAEIGYGNDNNAVGFRFSMIAGAPQASVFLRSSISGAPVDLENVKQTDWNVDTLQVLDWSKSQIFIIDFQSLAVGRIRFYIDRSGVATLVHEMHNDNLRAGPYWQNASLPPYWKIENTGIALATHRMLAICCTVKSEGGANLGDIPGFPFSATNGATPKTASTSLIPVLSIQLKTTFGGVSNRGLVIPTDLQMIGTNPAHYQLLVNPTLTGAAFASVNADSLCNLDTSATVIAGGRLIQAGYIGGGSGGVRGLSSIGLTGRIPLSVNALGTVGDILTVAAIRVGSSDSAVNAAINWKEVR